jgi:hypothetical protein
VYSVGLGAGNPVGDIYDCSAAALLVGTMESLFFWMTFFSFLCCRRIPDEKESDERVL